MEEEYVNIYNNLMMQYISKYWGLHRYEEVLEKKGFVSVDVSSKDVYQSRARGYFNYFFIRNDLHIDRLTDQEKQYLIDRYKSGNFDLTLDDEEYISKNILRVLIYSQDKSYMMLFGPDNSNYLKPANSLVIGLSYNDYYDLDDPNWEELHNKRESILYFYLDALESELAKRLNVPISVIKYGTGLSINMNEENISR